MLVSCPETPTPRRCTSPCLSQGPDLGPLPSSREHTLEAESEGFGDSPLYTCGRLPDALIDGFNEGFQEVNAIFAKLGASQGMPWQQVKDHYNHQYSRSNAPNLWNRYSTYFMKHTETELAWLPGDRKVDGNPSTEIRKECYQRFKEEYPDKYVEILETWKEYDNLKDIGETVAQRQQLFGKAIRNLDHMVHICQVFHL